ncbi:MAG TPA: hypothetical protein VK074_07320 [Fodinibius sp.]|nr:hypothetical protein [Fodinibius sp.]
MDSDSRNKRDRLKEEYKAHYRKMREAKERLSRVEKKQNITQALKDMDKSQILNSFDHFLHSVKHKLASVESRLDVAMDRLTIDDHLAETGQQLDEELNRTRAKESLKQLKMEMGLLYEEIEQQAGSIQVEKTIGSGREEMDPKEPSPKIPPDKANDKPRENE